MIKIAITLLLISKIVLAQNVEIHGAIKSAMHGNIKAKFNLTELQGNQNIYGLGAIEDLKGEITVIDSKAYVSKVAENSVIIDTTFNHKAALFAYSTVHKWKTDTLSEKTDPTKLETLLAAGIAEQSAPLTFLIEGNVELLQWHVIDWSKGDTMHTPQKHRMSGLHGELNNQWVTVIGYYSQNHKGILTHKNSPLHMHFITKDKRLAGHVDKLLFKKGIIKVAVND